MTALILPLRIQLRLIQREVPCWVRPASSTFLVSVSHSLGGWLYWRITLYLAYIVLKYKVALRWPPNLRKRLQESAVKLERCDVAAAGRDRFKPRAEL